MADAFFTCNTDWTGADARVQQQFNYLNTKTDILFNNALTVINALGALQVPTLQVTVPITDILDFHIEGFTEPPAIDDVDLTPLTMAFPPKPADPAAIGDINVGPAPTAPADPPMPTIPDAPVVYDPQFQAPPTLDVLTPPVYGDFTSAVPLPTMLPINLPPVPVVNIAAITFQGVRPNFTGVAPDPHDFAYVEPDYQVQIVTDIKPVIESMLAGTSGLPVAVENAIWARQAAREDEQALRAEQDAIDAWAAKGHGLPGGALNRVIIMTQQSNQDKRNSLGRDVMIQVHTVLIEQLKFAVAQGLAYEDLFIKLFSDVQNRKLQAARFAVDIAIAVFNALVGQYQAEAAVYKVDADVYLARIQGELAKVQVYGEQLRGLEIIGQLNQQSLQIYLGRLSAIETNVKVYIAFIEGYKTQIEANNLKLEQAKLLIEEETAKLNASDIETRIYLGQLQGQQTIQAAYATRAQVYMTSMQGFNIKNQIEIEKLRVEIADTEAITQRYTALVGAFSALAAYTRSRAELVVAQNQTRLEGYKAQVAGKSSYNTALVQKMQNIAQDVIADTEIQLKNGEINIQNVLEAHRIIEQKYATLVQVLASMTSAFASATNVNASISDQSAVNTSCNFNTSQSF